MTNTANRNICAFILAGGRGKRMDILCYLRPKPVLPFAGNFRVIDFTLSNCIHSHINNINVLVDYQRNVMANYLKEWQSTNPVNCNINIQLPKIGSYKGTAEAVYQNLYILEKQGVENILILAGDHIYKMDYTKMLSFHLDKKADVTVGVIPVPIEEAHRFGIVTTDHAGEIVDFVEKPQFPKSNLVSMGIYIFNKKVLYERLEEDAIQFDSSHDFGYSILPKLVHKNRVFAYKYDAYWQDIGTIESYYQANMELTQPDPSYNLNHNWPVLTQDIDVLRSKVSFGNNIKNSIVSVGCNVKGLVENSVLSPGVEVKEEAIIRNSIIMGNTSIGYHSVIDKCILDENVTIGNFCYVGFGSSLFPGNSDITVIGKEAVVPNYTGIGRHCRILPNVKTSDFNNNNYTPSGATVTHTAIFSNKLNSLQQEESRF